MDSKQFKKEYGFPLFPKIKYRGDAWVSCEFGLNWYTTPGGQKKFRIHGGRDRGSTSKHDRSVVTRDILCPLNSHIEWIPEINAPGYKAFGTLMILKPIDCDFEIRIGHISEEDINPKVMDILENGGIIPAGMYIARCGTEGYSTGYHTHTELVSTGTRSEILDGIIAELGFDPKENITDSDVIKFISDNRLDPAIIVEYENYRSGRGTKCLNENCWTRRDYMHWKSIKTFYSTRLLAI